MSERGAAALVVAVLAPLVAGAAVVAFAVSSLHLTRAKAAAAADAAALAGAAAREEGRAACPAAAALARANGTSLGSCRTSGPRVLVRVDVPVSVLGHDGSVQVTAVAGPVE